MLRLEPQYLKRGGVRRTVPICVCGESSRDAIRPGYFRTRKTKGGKIRGNPERVETSWGKEVLLLSIPILEDLGRRRIRRRGTESH